VVPLAAAVDLVRRPLHLLGRRQEAPRRVSAAPASLLAARVLPDRQGRSRKNYVLLLLRALPAATIVRAEGGGRRVTAAATTTWPGNDTTTTTAASRGDGGGTISSHGSGTRRSPCSTAAKISARPRTGTVRPTFPRAPGGGGRRTPGGRSSG
jgi:hypothetical protein